MKLWILPLLALALIVMVPSVEAAHCPMLYARNTVDFLQEIPQFNSQLQSCPVTLPPGASWIMGKGNGNVHIQMKDGTTESLTLTIANKKVSGIAKGAGTCSQQVTISQAYMDAALASRNRGGAFLFLFATKRVKVSGCNFWGSFKGFFAQPIGRMVAKRTAPASVPPPVAQGKPSNCDGTWLPGHRGYAENKQLWDSYSSDTDGVCQSQYGKGIPSPCAHSIQLSVSGNPYYLCWYNV